MFMQRRQCRVSNKRFAERDLTAFAMPHFRTNAMSFSFFYSFFITVTTEFEIMSTTLVLLQFFNCTFSLFP